jgi:hypothetical protein
MCAAGNDEAAAAAVDAFTWTAGEGARMRGKLSVTAGGGDGGG